MATYRNPSTGELDHKSPVTETLMQALANNPTAIAENADGAPEIVRGALKSGTTSTTISFVTGTAGETIKIVLGAYAFMGASSTQGADYEVRIGDGSADSASIYVTKLTPGSGSFTYYWRRLLD